MEFTELNKGIDSLYVSFNGTLKEGLKEQLELRKTLAQSDDEREQALATLNIDDHHFEVKDKGKGNYAYVLADGWYHIQVSASRRKSLPAIYVQVCSELLNRIGVYNSMNNLRGMVKELLIEIEAETVSRADIFVDFIADVRLEGIKRNSWIRKARQYQDYLEGDTFTGLSIGLGGVISARLYDKTKEIKKSNKDYLKSIWQKNGWSEGKRVWRLEFQLKREFLNQMHIQTVSGLLDLSNDIWRYCTHDWLRLSINSNTQNRSRQRIHPLWQMLQQVKLGPGSYTGITREISKSRMPNDRALFLNGLGYITAYAASKGLDEVNDKTMLGYLSDLRIFFSRHISNSKHKTFPDYVRVKINLKKRKYNQPIK